MAVSRVEVVDRNFIRHVETWGASSVSSTGKIPAYSPDIYKNLFKSQISSRLIDFEARRLKEKNLSFYTIGSAGHENNAALGYFVREGDPCFLHYRSGAFMLEHLKKDASLDVIPSILLSICASKNDPVSGGRHKVWGSKNLWVPPQTSTIASHLPKAVGMAVAIEKARHLKINAMVTKDAISVCTFGDASINHSTAQGAFNSVSWMQFQRLPVPILFVCEDNGIGISVKTPNKWVQTSMEHRYGFHYIQANGLDLIEATQASQEAVDLCRKKRQPVFLHLKTVRLLGHAGSDVETEYSTKDEIELRESQDPLIRSASWMLEKGWMSAREILDFYCGQKKKIAEIGAWAAAQPKLESASEVMQALAPFDQVSVDAEAKAGTIEEVEKIQKPRHMAMLINMVLEETLEKYPQALVFGEDVAKKGGVYHVTAGLFEKFGPARVFNTLLDEQTILGLGIGTSQAGFLPIPEIQYLAYFHNAEDQIRGEAASMQFFSDNQFQNPMVIRMASFGYQKGFGGHFHNDNSIGALRDIPGVVIAAPSRGDDAVEMFRTLMALAKINGRVSFFLEPIALYMTKDLYAENDGLWSFRYPAQGTAIAIGEPRVYEPMAKDLLIISYANGLYFSLRVAQRLREKGHNVKVVDLRWLKPLPLDRLAVEARGMANVLIVDECRGSGGGVADTIATHLYESGHDKQIVRVTALDTYVPLGPSANLVLPSEDQIYQAALNQLNGG